jgi:formate C-acetyltransferase
MAVSAPPETKQEQLLAPWDGFREGLWKKQVDVRDFIQQNYLPYEGDESFLAGATERTKTIWNRLNELFMEERKKGVLDISQIPGSITAHAPAEALDHAEWRPSDGAHCLEGVRL